MMIMKADGMAREIPASVVVVTYNNLDDLGECIPSLLAQSYAGYEVIVVDNGSIDGTPEYIRRSFPGVKVIDSGANLGYAGGNDAGFRHARGKYVAVVNPDTIADKDWLAELIWPLEHDPGVDITTSKVLMYNDHSKINTCGNISHYTGLGFCRGLAQPTESYSNPGPVGAISGCSFAIRRSALDRLGGFDPVFFMYLEDTDLSWRARLAGYHIHYIPSSIIYHKYKLSLAPWKMFYLERNRHIMLLKNYRWKTILLMFPPLAVTEIVTWGHCMTNGFSDLYNKLRAYYWVLTHFKDILEKRREVQELRTISDKEFISLLDHDIPFDQVTANRLLVQILSAVLNSFYGSYLTVMKLLI